ncbi:MAG: DNA polymerase IV [Pseudomonadota bacterium]
MRDLAAPRKGREMPSLCRDCFAWHETPVHRRCPNCGRPRLLSHPELGTLTVAHLDCDAFYASVEKRDNPDLSQFPVIVGGGRRGVVSTCCYVARIAGVRSAMPMFKALALCPDAVIIRPRMDHYAAVSREIRARMTALTPLVEPLSLDEAFMDLGGTERLLGAPPALSMARLAAEIEAEIGVSVSVGLSHNKYLAKIASDLDKPRGFSVIGRAETVDFLAPRPVRSIWGVGAAFAARLEADGYRTNADLSAADPVRLTAIHGSMGRRLWELAQGIDTRAVSPDHETKSISSETTFDDDLNDTDALCGHLWRLSVRTSDRAKAKGLVGATVTLKLKTAGFKTLSRQTRTEPATNHAQTLYSAAEPLLRRMLESGPYRLIGIGLSTLSQHVHHTETEALFEDRSDALRRAEDVTDGIRARFGTGAILRGRALK